MFGLFRGRGPSSAPGNRGDRLDGQKSNVEGNNGRAQQNSSAGSSGKVGAIRGSTRGRVSGVMKGK